jgi:hypothetical protein
MTAATPKAGSGKAPPPDPGTSTGTDGAASGRLSRAVIWTGIALGTALAVLVISDGARPQVGGMPGWLGVFAGAVIVWALIVMAAVTLAELTRRHHKTAGRYAVRQGKRGALSAGRASRRHGRALITRAAAWAGPRWQGRRSAEPAAGEAGAEDEAGDAPRRVPGPAETPEPAETPKRRVCVACGNPEGGTWGPLVTYDDGEPGSGLRLIHRAHFQDPATGFYGQPYQKGNEMENTTSRTPRERARDRGRRAASAAAGAAGAAWRQLIAATADYEPEDDSALLDWMAGEATGMAAYAESITDVYDTAVSGVGLDPVPLAALHDYADAAAACAEAMAAARAKFADHYAQVREFAAAGGLLPHDGRWITGEGT